MEIKSRLNGQLFPAMITVFLFIMTCLFGVTGWLLKEAYADVKVDAARIESKVDKNLEAINLSTQQVMHHLGEHSGIETRLDNLEGKP